MLPRLALERSPAPVSFLFPLVEERDLSRACLRGSRKVLTEPQELQEGLHPVVRGLAAVRGRVSLELLSLRGELDLPEHDSMRFYGPFALLVHSWYQALDAPHVLDPK